MTIGLLVAIAILGGATAGVVTVMPWGPALAAAVAAAALACLAPSRRGAAALLVLAASAAAAAHGAAARDRALVPPLVDWFNEATGGSERTPDLVTIDGVLAADAALLPDLATGPPDAEAGVRLVVDIDRVRDATGWRRAPGRAQIHVGGAQGAAHLRAWTAGRRIRAPASLRRPQMLLNFGGPSPFWQQLRRPFALSGSIKSAALVDVERGAWWTEAAAGARWRARDAVARFVAPRDAQAAAIVTAILIGDRAGLDDDVVRRLQMAGTYHVIAISGGNVALLTALCFVVLRVVVRSPRGVAVATMALTIAYGAIVVGGPSVTRAVTAACLYLAACGVGLAPPPLATLRTAAVALALADPLMVADVGAWLSFGATLGILLGAARIASVVPWGVIPPWCRLLLRPIVVVVAATIAAELILVPIAAAVFGRVTVAGVLLNLIAIPAMGIVQIAGLVTVAAGPLWPAGGDLSARIAGGASDLLVSSSTLVEIWPWLSWRVTGVTARLVAAYYGGLILAAIVWSRSSARAAYRRGLLVGAIALSVLMAVPRIQRAELHPGRLRVSLLDVGQGDAILVQLPHARSLLIDTGGGPGAFDIGSRVVSPAASALGVRQLTWLALTHGDRDHIGGALGVIADLAPREIWEGIAMPADRERAGLRRAAASSGIAWRVLRAGARIEMGEVVIDTLHPPDPDWERPRVRNDDSLVLRIRYGAVAVLLTGDAGAEFEGRLPDDLGAPAIRILKAGHHGSRTSTSDRLVRAMRPHVALVSVGRGNLFGHPAADVLARLGAAGTEVFRTDRDGAISLETDGVTVRVLTARGRRWTIVAPRSP